jgi:predicted NAD/FAD-binding protein
MLVRTDVGAASDGEMNWFWSRRMAPAAASVRRLTATLDDPVKFGRLLRELPESEELRPRLATKFYARAWDPATERDLWIVSDGTRVDCYVLTGLKFQQAASVRVRWDVNKREPADLSVETLADCVAKVTEGSVTLVEE